jgi:hypothetical protein
MSNQWINGPDITKGNFKVQQRQGIVVGNAKMHDAMVAMAKINPNPLYNPALGSTAENINYVKNGDIVFTFTNSRLRSMTHNGSRQRDDYSKMLGTTNLNGLFTKGSDHEEDLLLDQIEVLGFAEMGTANNKKDLYNIIMGGSFTIQHKGTQTIQNGQFCEVYAPSVEEIKNQEGGLGEIDDFNGEATLRLRPYRPENVSVVPKAVYRCLKKKGEPDNDYSKTFTSLCDAFIDSAIEMTIVIMSVAEDKGDFVARINKDLKTKEARQAIIDALFSQFGGELPKDMLGLSEVERDLEKYKYQSAGKFMSACSQLVHNYAKNVICRATSTADPGHNLNIQMRNYAF